MDPDDDLADLFEADRSRLVAIATRVVGSRADAEDVVQEAWVRLARQEPGKIENVHAWLTTVVGRLSIDVLRSRTAELPYELDLSELDVAEDTVADAPEERALQADSVGIALLVVLGTLGPDERLAFVLHDLFAVPFAQIGPILGKSADAAKMTASRARRKVHGAGDTVRPRSSRGEQRAVVDAFLTAAREGDFAALLEILDPQLRWEIHTSHRVTVGLGTAEILRAVQHGDPSRITARRVLVDDQPGIAAWGPNGALVSLMSCTVEGGRMTRIVSILDRKVLDRIDLPVVADQPESDGFTT
ncbi:sigma-70 family RNA polymerase sigma factor [Aeromicrobium choanae]|uniref:RNA polymerase sigma-70 factor, ECF subfamily n=1 Tax=Aeromicrobium choanae TaxID=1736691 RepID=A0A1T4Z936_9ACTN|nr:sigma-70 family RNA polymerase sigma factor [Aeromicrobium choanae]SKB10065.1 RNA polymerase sigma-70 factor, ECF subfamily [Aeromicrobium choanae]